MSPIPTVSRRPALQLIHASFRRKRGSFSAILFTVTVALLTVNRSPANADVTIGSRTTSAHTHVEPGIEDSKEAHSGGFEPFAFDIASSFTRGPSTAISTAAGESEVEADSFSILTSLTANGTCHAKATTDQSAPIPLASTIVTLVQSDFGVSGDGAQFTVNGSATTTQSAEPGQSSSIEAKVTVSIITVPGSDVVFEAIVTGNDSKTISGSGFLPPGAYRALANMNTFTAPFLESSMDATATADIAFTFSDSVPGIEWNNAAGGLFHLDSNWDPQMVPGTNDIAVFGLEAAYSVNVETATTERLIVRGGDVTFTNLTYNVTGGEFVPSGILLNNAKLTLTVGSLTGVHALIGESAAARLDLVDFASLDLSGSLQVGGPGNGILMVSGESDVSSGEGRIGNGVGGGSATVSGMNTFWNTGNLSVGFSGDGDLTASMGGSVVSEGGFVGFGSGTTGNVTIQGFGVDFLDDASNWTITADLTIGVDGTGIVNVLDFGRLDVANSTTVNGTLTISSGANSVHNSHPVTIGGAHDGTVTVSGSSQGIRAAMLGVSDLTLGELGQGTLTVENGALVSCTNAFVGVGLTNTTDLSGTGSIVVAASGEMPSNLKIEDQLEIGRTRLGKLTIEDGAQATAQDVTLGTLRGGLGILSLFGDPLVGTSTSLSVTGKISLALEGIGRLNVFEDSIVTCASAELGVLAGSEGVAAIGDEGMPGDPARWDVSGDITVGGLGLGEIRLRNNAIVTYGMTLLVNHNGLIGGNGSFVGNPIVINRSVGIGGNNIFTAQAVVRNSGNAEPGNSVGTLIIESDFEQTATGKLTIETIGVGDGEFDVLRVTGDTILDGILEMLFPGSYVPKTGDSFQFLEVDGVISGEFAEINFPQLLPGFQFDMTQTPGGMVFTALNDAVLAPTFLLNISTRLQVGTGDNVLIGGFILSGTEPKQVLIRAIGPSLGTLGVNGALADPTLELHDITGALIGQNDNWRTTQTGGLIVEDQFLGIHATGIPPINDAESAIIATLDPGAYTCILAGANSSTGIALVEVYDLGPAPAAAKLANISTRGLVQTEDNVMIGGFIIGNQTSSVLVRGIGPSLGAAGVNGALADPALELFDINGALLASNDNWRSDQEAEIEATTIPPNDDLESALLRSLAPGAYTAILRGVGDTTGVGLVEAYNLD